MKYKLIDSVVTNRDSENKLNLITLDDDEKIYSFTKIAADLVESLANTELTEDDLLDKAKSMSSSLDEEKLKNDISTLLQKLQENKLIQTA